MPEEFTIFFKDCKGKDLLLNVTNSMTVMQLKEMLFEKYGKNPEDLRFTYCNRPLEDDDDLRDISANSTIHMIQRLHGGYSGFGVFMADISNEEGLVKKNFNRKAP